MNKEIVVLGVAGILVTALIIHHNQKNLIRLAEQGHKVKIGGPFLYAEIN